MNPYKDLDEPSYSTVPHITYEDIASKLLQDHYLLTALELHTELVESGKELPQLREFFSNPGNFEQHVPRAADYSSMHRTPSIATLDSLDTARYSEDGGGDRGGSGGDVAVLEFELRKARETINALRANLTQFADDGSTLDKNSKDLHNQRTLKPHEKRALNFLVNEYLLLQDYKLTSITFSDENPDQDFEDWDDVGLNVSRPAGLVSLFWSNVTSLKPPASDASTQGEKTQCAEFQCQTELDEGTVCVSCQTSLDHDTDWNHEFLVQAEEIQLLKEKIIALETEKLDFQKLYDAAIVSLNSLTSPGSESRGLNLNIPEQKLQAVHNRNVPEAQPLTCTATENYYSSNNSTHSATPEQFELIDNEKTAGIIRKDGSNTSSFDPAIVGDSSVRDSPLRRGSVTTIDETLSINDGGEWTRLQFDYPIETNSKDMWIDSSLPNNLKGSLLNWCCEKVIANEPIANEHLQELVNNDKAIDLQGLLILVADTLPKMIPHTLVSRRCEAAALLACTIHLLSASGPSGAMRRSRLLQTLLTLIKKPDSSETRIICEAACLIVKWGGSCEVLSCIVELLASRSSERRLLASQICLSIAPYVSIELCTSLLLSLMMLMCESSEAEIRHLGLKTACLVCPVADHKYGQLENLLFNFLRDPIETNVRDAVNVFVPVLARSALVTGKFQSDLCARLMANLTKSSNEKDWKNVILHLEIMRVLVLAKLVCVINVQIVKDTHAGCDDGSAYQEVSLDNDQEWFLDSQCYLTDGVEAKTLLVAVSRLLNDRPDFRWPELEWFISLIKSLLHTAGEAKYLNYASVYELVITLFSNYVDNFGYNFTLHVLKPIFTYLILELEQKMERLQPVSFEATIVVGIYLATVLFISNDNSENATFFQKWVIYSSIRGLPLRVISVPLKWVAKHKADSLNVYLQLLREFAASSTEGASGVAVRVYIASLVSELVNTAPVSEMCLQTSLLLTVLALMNDDDGSVRENAITAWGATTRECVSRGLECASRCWAALEALLSGDSRRDLTAREAARAAEGLALLILPTTNNTHAIVSEKAVGLLCTLCHLAPITGESLSALAPGLQLIAHHARSHPALLPALRRIEESVQSPSLAQYRHSIEALIHNATAPSSVGSYEAQVRETHARHAPTSNLQAAQEAVGRRVTQMFHNSKGNMNLPNIFKKKT